MTGLVPGVDEAAGNAIPTAARAERTDAALIPFWPLRLDEGWQCLSTPAGACASPTQWPKSGWLDAIVPGTVAAAWRAAGRLDPDHLPPFAFDDHWYRLSLTGDGPRRLRLHGLATLTEVWLDGEKRLESDSMFVAHDLDIELHGTVTLALCFRSLAPALAARRTRARWRPRLASPATLRNVRTTLLGHMPGWCPPLQAVGPWRPVELLGGGPCSFDTVDLRTELDGDDGLVHLTLTFVQPQNSSSPASLSCSDTRAPLVWQDPRTLTGTLRVPHAPRWWPHTHGTPTLHTVTLELDGEHACELGRVGFRTLEVDRGSDDEGFALRINGTPVFCRGACWTSADLATLAGTDAQLSHAFALARDAGMNMLRVGGTMVYESDAFYALADAYGILVWQDFAFANFDYPSDADFIASVTREATQFLARTCRFASLAVLCGGSEIDQQAAMFGLPPAMRAHPWFTEQLPAIVAAQRPDVPYVAHSPGGGVWPFSTRTGITHYYGVGAYQRPLEDVRRANVRFAAECLAFANVPDDATLHDATGTIHVHDPRWKAAVPRDPGAGWDFDDVRDHYLRTLYGVDPAQLRYADPSRYLDLSRAVVAELMIDTFAEWRSAHSTCGGALVWQFQDLRAGAGWGLVDALGRPKSTWHALAAVLQPVQVVITDEGLNGLDLHVINDTAKTLHGQLDLVCLRDGAVQVASGSCAVQLAPRSRQRIEAATCLGQFFDFTYAYRFGPQAHDVTIVTLRDAKTGEVWSEAFHLPDRQVHERHDLGLTARPERTASGWQLIVETRRFSRFVHIADQNYRAVRDWFHLAPHRPLAIPLVARDPLNANDTTPAPEGEVRAINARATIFYR
ncbi:glycosyl hydrolase 2 galactose-binding domain-containing protein [Paraburkholderia megapolitana]|uniref:beta-mannosidase n=1 Tax=Paraburkholderia megapolitana TaxID=420953 RepID=A0A1I3R9X0_9BURK|nr:glycoside hydrolase family 2 protein [Paraburkholderia megapolitana]SFJ43403.1 beta-mannosidase [Paraburkholderia megapolitana]